MLGKLIKVQAQEGMSDRQFAGKLGISTQLWQATRTGKRPIGLTLIKAVIRAYPSLRFDVFESLCRECYEKRNTIPQKARQSLRERFLAAFVDRWVYLHIRLINRLNKLGLKGW